MRRTWWICVTLLVAGVTTAEAAALEDILAKHAASRGGLEALRKVQTLRVRGTLQLDGQESFYNVEWKRPDKVRLEYGLGGMTSVEAFDGDTAWAISPFANDPSPLPLAGARARRAAARADYLEGALIDAPAKGHTIELLGDMTLDEVRVHKLRVHKANGDVHLYYLDTEQGRIVRTEGDFTMGTRTLKRVTRVSDYRKVGGIWLAHRRDVTIGRGKEDMHGVHGGRQTVTIDTVEINLELEDTVFTMQ